MTDQDAIERWGQINPFPADTDLETLQPTQSRDSLFDSITSGAAHTDSLRTDVSRRPNRFVLSLAAAAIVLVGGAVYTSSTSNFTSSANPADSTGDDSHKTVSTSVDTPQTNDPLIDPRPTDFTQSPIEARLGALTPVELPADRSAVDSMKVESISYHALVEDQEQFETHEILFVDGPDWTVSQYIESSRMNPEEIKTVSASYFDGTLYVSESPEEPMRAVDGQPDPVISVEAVLDPISIIDFVQQDLNYSKQTLAEGWVVHRGSLGPESREGLFTLPIEVPYLPSPDDRATAFEVITSNGVLVQINMALETSAEANPQRVGFATVTFSEIGEDQQIQAPKK